MKNTLLCMGRNVGIQQCEGMTVSGGRQEKGFLNAILFAFSVRGREQFLGIAKPKREVFIEDIIPEGI